MLERIHLAIVQEVDRQGSLTAAAGALHLTQSALSHAVRKLEEQLGTALWIREGRSLRPTQAGEYLLAVANRVLPQLDQAEERLRQFARGERGTLRIGMECHPCYQWLLKIVSPYLAAWPTVEVDVKQKFQFGGVGALFGYDIDLLVTPDPFFRPGLVYEPVFDYEQVLVVSGRHRLAQALPDSRQAMPDPQQASPGSQKASPDSQQAMPHVLPDQLADEILLTYPVETERLDIYNQFLIPAGVHPRRHKIIENTDIMLQMVASGRGVTALPRWLVEEYAQKMDIVPLRLGPDGIAKQIHLGYREGDAEVDYLRGFVAMAREGTEHKNKLILTY
ncbi:LysR family transcriptional regulator [Lautropia dentalis]|uniref:HTH-type transcriptional regulator MetR n=1 Tax=Lautropia dentalis TaxID=2490857 RepID=A0A426FQT1_9BURK|nr:LysR family transcriptional regulator [Lautropia dentalis]RRN45058.1 LysR family transcriptional regulator [Lautropia dentalis]